MRLPLSTQQFSLIGTTVRIKGERIEQMEPTYNKSRKKSRLGYYDVTARLILLIDLFSYSIVIYY